MKVRSEELGLLATMDSGNIAIFNMEMIDILARKLNLSSEDLLTIYGGVQAHVGPDKAIGVDAVHSVLEDGIVEPSVLIASHPDSFKRFLAEHEKTYPEFQLCAEQEWELSVEANRQEWWSRKEQEYKDYVLGRTQNKNETRPNPDLDNIMGG